MENALSFARSPLPPLSPTPFHPRFQAELRLSRLNRSNSDHGNRFMFARNAFGSDENGSLNGFSSLPNEIFMDEVIGAEYGEGFETFRLEGPLKVDVAEATQRLSNIKEAPARVAGLQSHEDLARKLQKKWTEMFPCIVSRTTTFDAISNSMGGTRNGALHLFGYNLVNEIVAAFTKNLGSIKYSCEISNCSSLVLIYVEEKISSLSRLMRSSIFYCA